MNIKFPDELFEVEELDRYIKNIQLGKKIAQNSSITFCGIIRNAGKSLALNIERVKKTSSFFCRANAFAYENNSTDNTLEVLRNSFFDYKSVTLPTDYLPRLESGEDSTHYERCCALAECRKEYVKYVEENPTDYVCVVDLDIVGGWSYNGFLHAIAILEDNENNACSSAYGVLADPYNKLSLEEVSPSRYIMYDSFAFRPTNCEIVHNNQLSVFNFVRPNIGGSPVILESNFNGMSIYKRDFFLKGKYRAELINENCANSEHIAFHRDIIEAGGRIIMDPSLIVSYSKHRYCNE